MTENNPKMTELRVKIRTEVLQDFRDFVTNKYGKLHSVLSIEVERALESYSKKPNTHEEKEIPPFNTSEMEEFHDKRGEIKTTHSTDNGIMYGNVEEVTEGDNNGKNVGKQSTFFTNILNIREHCENDLHMDSDFPFHPSMLQNHIRKNYGGDDRTVKKYITALKPYLKPSDGMLVTFNYEKFDSEWV